MTEDTTTKLVRIESIVDAYLAMLIQLPAPLTTCVSLGMLGGMFVAGMIVRGWF